MSFLNPEDKLEVQVEKQARIIEALVNRSNRQSDVGPSAFLAFKSALELQQKVAAQSRDLERVATELESARYQSELTRRSLVEALASLKEGFALFSGGKLDLCNDLFRDVLPDIAADVRPGLSLESFLSKVAGSAHVVSTDRPLDSLLNSIGQHESGGPVLPMTVVEISGDRWYQLTLQRSSSENLVILLAEITSLVRRNRDEKEVLIDQQADYLRAVFHNVNSGMCTFTEAGEVILHNRQFRDLLGLPPRLVEKGTLLAELMDFLRSNQLVTSPEPNFFEHWKEELRERGSISKRVRHLDGRVLDIQANRLPDGGFVIELTDVTLEARAQQILENRVMERTAELTHANAKLVEQYEEQAKVEEELRVAKERAEAAVSAKTRFLAAASHDLLQPINAAKLMISTLSETTRGTATHGVVQRLEGAFGSAEQLLHSLLDISRLESPGPDTVTPTEVCLAPILESIFQEQRLVAEERNVRLDLVPCSAFVRSDPVYLLRSIQNLVVNAIQYTMPGGRVLIGCRQSAGEVTVQVWDTGIGIKPADRERVFDAFARANDLPGVTGMGLGLSVVDRACRLLDHRLSFHSKPGKGSIFSIQMDRIDPVELRNEPTVVGQQSVDLQFDVIVLVIEDDLSVRESMTEWLEQWGASVIAVGTPQEALSQIDDMGMPPDILLADYQLAGEETGLDAVKRIRAHCRQPVPAVLITANRSNSVWQAAEQNAVTVMVKPVRLNRLKALINWKTQQAEQMLVL